MKKDKMFKWIVMSYFIMTLLAFGYSLGFFTNFVQISGADRKLYDLLQLFNHKIFNISLYIFIVSAFMFMFGFQRSIKGILGKGVAILSGAASLYLSYFVMKYLPILKDGYSKVDIEAVQLYFPNYESSTLTFSYGYAIFGILIVMSVLLIVSTFLRKEKEA